MKSDLKIENRWNIKSVDEVKSSDKHAMAMGPFGSNITTDNFVQNGIPVIRGVNLKNNRFNEENFVFISTEKADELIASNAQPEDIVFTHRGTLGQVIIIPKNCRHKRYVVSQSQMKLTCDKNKVVPLFVYYFFCSPQGQQEINMYTNSTGVPSISSPLSSLKMMQFPCPSLQEQKKIVEVLDQLDSKIENLQNQNKVLEQIAQAIFKSWFVDFDGVTEFEDSELGQIPKGWRVESLDENIDFLNGLALQKFRPKNNESLPVIKIKEMKEGLSNKTERAGLHIDPKYIIKNGDILFSWSGSLELTTWHLEDGALNQHIFKVTSQKYNNWFLYQWIKFHLPDFRRIAEGKVTTMGHIQKHHLSEARILIPPPKILQKYNSIFQPLFDQLLSYKLESELLTKIRDSLLPKLMSGEIRV